MATVTAREIEKQVLGNQAIIMLVLAEMIKNNKNPHYEQLIEGIRLTVDTIQALSHDSE